MIPALQNKCMYATFHLSSAEEVNTEILNAIKATFKSKPITIIVEDDEDNDMLNAEMKTELDNRLAEPTTEYINVTDSINQLNKKYGL